MDNLGKHTLKNRRKRAAKLERKYGKKRQLQLEEDLRQLHLEEDKDKIEVERNEAVQEKEKLVATLGQDKDKIEAERNKVPTTASVQPTLKRPGDPTVTEFDFVSSEEDRAGPLGQQKKPRN